MNLYLRRVIHPQAHDSYRVILKREDGEFEIGSIGMQRSRGGTDWSDRFPLIVEAARKNRHKQFIIDGEAVLLTVTGLSDFNGLCSRRHDKEVQLYAFDILALDGEDLRRLPLYMRKQKLAACCNLGRPQKWGGIFAADFEQGEIGPDLFRAACTMGLEGLVSKRADRPYRAGRSMDWVKIKNRKHPAYRWVLDQF